MPTPRRRHGLAALVALGALLFGLLGFAPNATAAPAPTKNCATECIAPLAPAGPAPTSLAKDCVKQGKAVTSAACTNLFKKECGKDFKQNKADCVAYTDAKAKTAASAADPCPHIILIQQDCESTLWIAKAGVKTYKVAKDPGGSLASAAFDAAAQSFGKFAAFVLKAITYVFLKESVIDLSKAGVQSTYEMLWGLSGLIAVILLLLQFAKVAITASGQAAATALLGLVRWVLICMAGMAVTQFALYASDDISEWLIQQFYKNDAGFEKRLGATLIAFLVSQADDPAMILTCAILAIVALLCLWGEMLMRAAAIQVLVACLPIAAAGTMMDGTKEWFAKTRNAIISLILIKPVIVLIFVIGFSEFTKSSDLNGFLVGLLTIILGVFAWPAVAKFMTFTTVGGGSSFLSGFLGAVGGTAAGIAAAGAGVPSGVGALGGNKFTKGMEAENDASVAGMGGGGGGKGGGGGSKGGGGLGALLGGVGGNFSQAAPGMKAGKEQIEGGMEAMAAHADLGPGKDMGGQMPPGGGPGGGDEPPPPAPPSGGPAPEPPTVTLDRAPSPGNSPKVITPSGDPASIPPNGASQLTPVPPPNRSRALPPPPPKRSDGGSGS